MTEGSSNTFARQRVGRQFDCAAFLLMVALALGAYTTSTHTWMIGTVLYYGWVILWGWRNIKLHCDEHGKPFDKLGAGFWVTWVRVALLGALIGILGQLDALDKYPWLAVSLYGWLMLLDAVDGTAARASGTVSEFGARLDNHSDALGILAASMVAIYLQVLPWAYLSLSGSYLLFHAGLELRSRFGYPVFRDRMMNSFHNRYFAGVHMLVLALALIPGSDPYVMSWTAMVGLGLLLLCFVRDWLLVSGTLDGMSGSFGAYWRRVASFVIRQVGPMVRIVLLIIIVVQFESVDLGVGLTLLFVAAGALGRTGSLCLVGAHAFGWLVLPLWAVGPVVFVAWLGPGMGSLCRFDDAVYLERRADVSGYGLGVALFIAMLFGASLLYACQPDLVSETWSVIRKVGWRGATVVGGLNFLILVALSLRSYWVLKALRASLGLVGWFRVRQVGFLVSFLTPGPQIGGEPAQVWLMCRQGVSTSDAIGVTAVDKLADFVLNAAFLLFSVLILGAMDIRSHDVFITGLADWVWPIAAGSVLTTLCAYTAYRVGLFRLSWVQSIKKSWSDLSGVPRLSWSLLGLTGTLAWALMFIEWWAIWWLLGAQVPALVALATFLATRFALWTPVPGGLGVLEAGVVGVSVMLGVDVSVALAVCAVARLRDMGLIAFAALNAAAEVALLKEELSGTS